MCISSMQPRPKRLVVAEREERARGGARVDEAPEVCSAHLAPTGRRAATRRVHSSSGGLRHDSDQWHLFMWIFSDKAPGGPGANPGA